VVLKGFSDHDPARRAAAIEAIKSMNTPPRQILRTLLEFAKDSDPGLRYHSIEALVVLNLNHPYIVTTCLQALSDPDPGVRVAAAGAVSQASRWTTNRELSEVSLRLLDRGGSLESNIITSLTILLNDPEPAVRSAAQRTLSGLQSSSH
jgi:HEAT repeat protein